MAVLRLGRYRRQITAHLAQPIHPYRPLRALLLLAALYHDCAKPLTRQVEPDGQTRFFGHDEQGAALVAQRAQASHLSNDEVLRLASIVRHHMRPLLLAQGQEAPTRRAIYRFFRDAGDAGIDICLLSLADTLGTYSPGLPEAVWIRHLEIVRTLLEARWEQTETQISPPALLDGHDLMATFHLAPGRLVGQLLEQIREAQAAGEVQSREEALAFARARLEKQN
jgi:putative nucleotidyltransferase with HDIG domain